jgi:hypothetical protein
MPYEVVSAYTLLVGDEDGPMLSVHTTAPDAWHALDREIRERCGMRARPQRRASADAATRLANAWRDADPECRYWNLTVHRLPVTVPVIAAPPMVARPMAGALR